MAENILDHGGVLNDQTESANNITAIHDASVDAADNTVYIPGSGDPSNPNKLYFGDSGIVSGNMLMPGNSNVNRGARGLGFIGDDPETSHLVWGEVHGDANNIIKYDDDDGNVASHDNVLYRDLTYDGNYQNLNFDGGTQSGMRCIATMNNMTVDNSRFRNFHSGVHRFSADADITVDYCTYHETGIGRANQGGGSSSHPISGDSGTLTATVTNTEFTLIRGSCIDWGDQGGGGTIRNIYSEGVGINLVKINEGGSITLENIRHIGQTQELLDSLDNSGNDLTNYGRWCFRRHVGDNDVDLTVGNIYATKCCKDFFVSGGPMSIVETTGPLDGEDIAVDTLDQEQDNTDAITDYGGPNDFNVTDGIAVNNVDGTVFDLDNATGSVDQVNRQNTGGLGATDGMTVQTDNAGGALFGANVPAQGEVGINAQEAQYSTDMTEYDTGAI